MDTNQVPRHESEHLSADTLAELAENPGATVDKRHLAHLAHCRSCMAAYSDAVRYRTAWLGSPEMFEETEDEPGSARPSSARLVKYLPFAAGLLVVIGIGAWAVSQRRTPVPEDSPPIAALLERASGADLVLPGGEPGAAIQEPPYREGGTEHRAAREAIEVLRLRYERGERSISDLYLLAASLTASGRADLAHDYIQEGRRLAPGNPSFLLLEAVIARREGRLDRADQLLRQARTLSPKDLTILFDHAVVLEEKGEVEPAADLLREVIRRAPSSPLAQRAERVLATASPR